MGCLLPFGKPFKGPKTRATSGAASPTLNALTLSASTIAENSAPGTVIGAIQGATAGSTVTLLVDDGSRVAKSSNNIVAGATNIDYETTTNPRSFTLREVLAGALNTPRDTVINYTVTDVAEGSAMATPTLTRKTGDAAGSAPLNLEMSWTPPTGESPVGYMRWLRFYSDAGLTTLTQSIVDQIEAEEYSSNISTMGYATPPGQFWTTLTMLRENDINGAVTVSGAKTPLGYVISDFNADASTASTPYTDTILTSVAVWTATTGTKKSQYIGTPTNGGLTLQGTAGVVAALGIAATIVGANVSVWEHTLDLLATDSNRRITFGRYNGTTDLNAFARPGVSDANGYEVQYTPGNTGLAVFFNSATQIGTTVTLASAAALNDVWTDELDISGAAGTHVLKVYRNGTLVFSATGRTFTGFNRAYLTIQSNEKITGNFGATTFVHAGNIYA